MFSSAFETHLVLLGYLEIYIVHAKDTLLQIMPEENLRVCVYYQNKPDIRLAVAIGHVHRIGFNKNDEAVCLTHKFKELDCCKEAIEISYDY